MYRGILLPFSSDDERINFIYGVINWKELADQQTTDELLLQIDQALDATPRRAREDAPLTEWADGPADLADFGHRDAPEHVGLCADELPEPVFGAMGVLELDDIAAEQAPPEAAMELAEWLASARELAQQAKGSEDRSRQSLYAAISRAYDFAIAAAEAPEESNELVEDAGLTVQQRAPMTPLVKLVFGVDYDKTRLAEYTTVLNHARRLGLGRGKLAAHLAGTAGGLKGIVAEERKLRRGNNGTVRTSRHQPRNAIACKLRDLETRPLNSLPSEGAEFAVLVARRMPDGTVALLGEVGDDGALIERAAKLLLG
jgi:hypothetical protein